MTEPDSHAVAPGDDTVVRFNPLKIVIPVLLALLSVSLVSQWYAKNIGFPRYCKQPDVTLDNVRDLIEEGALIDNEQRRQYMIAAKILFMHPRLNDESKTDYLQRLRHLMLAECQ
ncbi:MAG: hypothetical protein GY784_00230 [Gammaproteobacteria bacterium]|nr:hypothetical protein [Gammaproteobacteria bacterium]